MPPTPLALFPFAPLAPPVRGARRCGTHGSRTGAAWPAACRRLAAAVVLLALAGTCLAPRAWDADTMLRAASRQGPRAVAGARALQAALASLDGADDAGKLAVVNDFFNHRIAFKTDQEVWGQEDYWASPLEMLGKGAGDCEDYVIGKYFGLLAAGVPMGRLRLVYVRATLPGGSVAAHMVLAYYSTPGAEPLVLDNLVGQVRPAGQRPDLVPVFSFNGEGLWQGVGNQRASDPAGRLSPWRDVMDKARAEGFQ